MRTYVAITGVLFLTLAGIHLVRMFAEPTVAHDPFFIVITLLAVGLAAWALALFRRPTRP